MVAAQYRLVRDGLHVNHLSLVMGTSMGCMHSWLWAERYPDAMDGVVPLACLPTQVGGRTRMGRRMISAGIRSDPAWRSGEYTNEPPSLRAALELLFVAGSSPLQLQRAAPTRDSADAYVARWLETRLADTDANDLVYQVEASADYDPSPDLERVAVPVLAINSADDFINPPELGLMERLIRLEHQDPIRHPHRREAVRDQHRHPTLRQLRESQEPLVLGAGVERGGRLVEDQHLRIPHVRASERDLLPLTARELDAAVEAPAKHLVVAARDPSGDRVRQAAACRFAHAGVVVQRLHLAHPHVLPQDEVVAHEVLEDDPDVLAQTSEVVRTEVHAVEQQAALIRVVQPRQQLHQCGLPRPVLPYQRDALVRLEREAQVTHRPAIRARIPEPDVLELEAPPDRHRRRLRAPQ